MRWQIGRVVGARGLRGELRVRARRPDSGLLEADRLYLIGGPGEWGGRLLGGSWGSPTAAIIELEGLLSREQADRWIGAEVWVDEAAFAAGNVPSERLLGADVVSAGDDAHIGRVSAIDHNGAQEILVVQADSGAERMVPLVPAFVEAIDESVDGRAGCVKIRAIPGLLED